MSSLPQKAAHSVRRATATSDNSVHVLRCLVEGEPMPFKVRILADDDIGDLKELVLEKGINAAKRPGILSQDLVLLKVRHQLEQAK